MCSWKDCPNISRDIVFSITFSIQPSLKTIIMKITYIEIRKRKPKYAFWVSLNKKTHTVWYIHLIIYENTFFWNKEELEFALRSGPSPGKIDTEYSHQGISSRSHQASRIKTHLDIQTVRESHPQEEKMNWVPDVSRAASRECHNVEEHEDTHSSEGKCEQRISCLPKLTFKFKGGG